MMTTTSSLVWVMFFLSIGACEAFFQGGGSSVVRCESWTEAAEALRRREVPAALVESVSLCGNEGWNRAREGDSSVVFDLETSKQKNIEAASIALGHLDEAVLPGLLEIAERYFDVLGAAGGSEEASSNIRCRVTVSSGKQNTAPCPKVHTDNTFLRCLVPVMGPGTVFVPTPPLFTSEKIVPVVATQPGNALLLKGRLWPTGSAARHKSPDPVDSTRVLVSLDRSEDIL